MILLCIKMEHFTMVSTPCSVTIESQGWLNRVQKHEIIFQSHSFPMHNQRLFLTVKSLTTLPNPRKLNTKEKHASINKSNSRNITVSSDPNKVYLQLILRSYSTMHDEKLNNNNKDPFDVVTNLASRLPFPEIGVYFFWGSDLLILIGL